MRLLFDDTNLRDRLAHNAAQYALRNFGLDKMVDSYLAYYKEILHHWAGKTKSLPVFAEDHQQLPNHQYKG
jgi:hypothetical protein